MTMLPTIIIDKLLYLYKIGLVFFNSFGFGSRILFFRLYG